MLANKSPPWKKARFKTEINASLTKSSWRPGRRIRPRIGARRRRRNILRGLRRDDLADPVQQIDGGDQLFIGFGLGGHIGLRPHLLVVAVLEMALERSLALDVVLAFQLVRHVFEDLDVGLDTLGLD